MKALYGTFAPGPGKGLAMASEASSPYPRLGLNMPSPLMGQRRFPGHREGLKGFFGSQRFHETMARTSCSLAKIVRHVLCARRSKEASVLQARTARHVQVFMRRALPRYCISSDVIGWRLSENRASPATRQGPEMRHGGGGGGGGDDAYSWQAR